MCHLKLQQIGKDALVDPASPKRGRREAAFLDIASASDQALHPAGRALHARLAGEQPARQPEPPGENASRGRRRRQELWSDHHVERAACRVEERPPVFLAADGVDPSRSFEDMPGNQGMRFRRIARRAIG